MNKELFDDVREILNLFEGCPVGMARIALETALKLLERHSYVSVKNFEKELREVKNNG